MALIKIQNGTRSNATNLCDTCEHCFRVKGSQDSQEIYKCTYWGMSYRLPWPVVDCNSYADKSKPSIRSMEQIAWFFDPSLTKKNYGFMKKDDFKKAGGKTGYEDPWD